MLAELWSDLRYRVRALLHRADVERELEHELQFHLERAADQYEQSGMSPREARRQARLAFGGVERAKEESRDGRGTVLLEALAQDVRYAIRGLYARPAFTTGVVLTLALGIGANAAMFGIIDRLLLRPPEYLRDPAHVHRVYLTQTRAHVARTENDLQFPRYLDLARWSHDFSSSTAFASWRLAVGDGEVARMRQVVGASASYFAFFDAKPIVGRFFSTAEDSVPLGAAVAVLGYDFWRTEFGGAADVLGRQLRIDHTLCTIIGVAPPGFHGFEEANNPAVYIPVTTFGLNARGPGYATNYGFQTFGMIVRRKPDISISSANADLTEAFRRSWVAQSQLETALPPLASARPSATIGPVQRDRGPLAGPEARIAVWVGGVTLVVLLIACANVANLLLARAVARRREIALRRALGVTNVRLIQQLFIESAVLAACGGVLGVALAQWGGGLLRALFLPRDFNIVPLGDGRTLIAALTITFAVALLTGVAPVLDARRSSFSHVLAGAGRDTGLRSSRGRATLLVLQAALSVVLLVGAGLFVRSLQRVHALRLGYDVNPILVVTDNARGVTFTPAEQVALENRLVETAKAIPGVLGASVVSSIPFWGFEGRKLFVAGVDSVDLLGNFDLQAASPGYFHTAGTRVLRGRAFDERDAGTAPRVVVVSQAMANALWPRQEPLGQCIRIAARDAPCATVIGVAEDLHIRTLRDAREYTYYVPIAQHGEPEGMLLVRVAGSAGDYAESVRQQLQRVMPGASFVTAEPFSGIVDPEMQSWKLGSTMFVAFGGLALALAGIGLYSVIAYAVAQRRRELGVRIALGASQLHVISLVMHGGVRLVLVGIVLGAAIALSSSRAIAPLLFQETGTDATVYAVVAAVLLTVALLASVLPALAAARLDPNTALRAE